MIAGPEILLEARGLTKWFSQDRTALPVIAEVLTGRKPENRFKAVDNVDLTLHRGEALAIIGRNGSGKSTLLHLCCGTQEAGSGTITRNGRIAALLELGAGFNPDFTGHENARLTASIYGLSDAETEARMPRIEAFAEIGEFIDRPVREYSSGMYARLGFAVCAHVDADILIVDEILGVGDSAFQRKCRHFMRGFLETGAILFVSHDEAAVLNLCSRAIWLESGSARMEGNAPDVTAAYRNTTGWRTDELTDAAPIEQIEDNHEDDGQYQHHGHDQPNPMQVSSFAGDAPWFGHGGARIIDTCFMSPEGKRLAEIHGGQDVVLRIDATAERNIDRPITGFIFRNRAGQNLFGDNTFLAYCDNPPEFRRGETFSASFAFRMPYLPDGEYAVAPSVIEGTQLDHVHLFWMERALTVVVKNSPVRYGLVGVAALETVIA